MSDSKNRPGSMNPHAPPSISPLEIINSAVRNRSLVCALIQRDISGRYRGSSVGLIWTILNPLIMVSIYTFVFSVAFKARWVGGAGTTAEFALLVFCGVIVFNILIECLNRAPTLVIANPSYVKKVIFPLETLAFVAVGTALFHAFVSFGIWCFACAVLFGPPKSTLILLPIVLLPLIIVSLGVTWLFASLGVFVRDIAQIVPFASTVLLFMSPVFYPADSLPATFRPFMYINPLTLPIENARTVLFLGGNVDWYAWALSLVGALIFCYLSFVWFQKTRKGFADVV